MPAAHRRAILGAREGRKEGFARAAASGRRRPQLKKNSTNASLSHSTLKIALERMSFKRHFARVGAAERCTESIFTDHQRQVCDFALSYAEKKNDGEAPYSVSFTATQSGDVIVQLHQHSQLERAVRHDA